jgi:phage nucleotide-binding protein
MIKNKMEEESMYKKIWVYGAPFSGKTTLACGSPKHWVISTDGNAQYITDNFKLITDVVTKNGRITTRKLAWEVLKEEIERLEGGVDYETIVVDLVEDTYEMARLFMYQKLGITHESDDSFRAWDKVRTEYLSTMRRLINLPYNIVLISHEDTSKDITKKSGENITAIKPNINDKVANKLAGMVALVARAVVDGNDYTIQVKTDEVIFGGGRLGINNVVIPNAWDEIVKLFEKKPQ